MKRNILIVVLISISIFSCSKNKQNNDSQNIVNLNSSEYKLLLNPIAFEDYNIGFEKYWSIIKEIAEEQNITIVGSEDPFKMSHKNIGFFDTKDMDLRKNGYMLRRKIKINNDGEQKKGVEFSLKFRSTDPQIANTADVKIGDGFTPKHDEIELESDVVYYSVANGKTETTYSVQNVIELDESPKLNTGEFAKIYPVLGTLGIPLDKELKVVGNTQADEYMIRPGKLDFGDGLYGRMDITVWIVDLDGKNYKIPEFSFDHPFYKDKKYNDEAMERCTVFINKLYEKYPDLTVPGKLKAAYLFEHEAEK